jgi:hypothetical protein
LQVGHICKKSDPRFLFKEVLELRLLHKGRGVDTSPPPPSIQIAKPTEKTGWKNNYSLKKIMA